MGKKKEVSIQKIIESTSDIAVNKAIKELKKQRLLKDSKSAFQKTEILLYNYSNFKESIENKYKQIDTIIISGSNRKSSSITTYSSNNVIESKLEEERAEEQIAKIEQSIAVTQNYITTIDAALEKIKGDKYYKIIPLKYFEGKTREEIAMELSAELDETGDRLISEKTITRNKNRLINKLKIDLFSDEALLEMLL